MGEQRDKLLVKVIRPVCLLPGRGRVTLPHPGVTSSFYPCRSESSESRYPQSAIHAGSNRQEAPLPAAHPLHRRALDG